MDSAIRNTRNKRLLLISSSYTLIDGRKSDFLEGHLPTIQDFLEKISPVLFIPFARHQGDWDQYTGRARQSFAKIGIELTGLHLYEDKTAGIRAAKAIVVGGGNTYRLTKNLHEMGIFTELRQFVHSGNPYIGSSAGSVLAGNEITTTNDKNILKVSYFQGLRVFPWDINPHYVDPKPGSTYTGETREQQLKEFFQEPENASRTIIGLPDDSLIWVQDGWASLRGSAAKIFRSPNINPMKIWHPTVGFPISD